MSEKSDAKPVPRSSRKAAAAATTPPATPVVVAPPAPPATPAPVATPVAPVVPTAPVVAPPQTDFPSWAGYLNAAADSLTGDTLLMVVSGLFKRAEPMLIALKKKFGPDSIWGALPPGLVKNVREFRDFLTKEILGEEKPAPTPAVPVAPATPVVVAPTPLAPPAPVAVTPPAAPAAAAPAPRPAMPARVAPVARTAPAAAPARAAAPTPVAAPRAPAVARPAAPAAAKAVPAIRPLPAAAPSRKEVVLRPLPAAAPATEKRSTRKCSLREGDVEVCKFDAKLHSDACVAHSIECPGCGMKTLALWHEGLNMCERGSSKWLKVNGRPLPRMCKHCTYAINDLLRKGEEITGIPQPTDEERTANQAFDERFWDEHPELLTNPEGGEEEDDDALAGLADDAGSEPQPARDVQCEFDLGTPDSADEDEHGQFAFDDKGRCRFLDATPGKKNRMYCARHQNGQVRHADQMRAASAG